jgi:excisionase family DNA binding protein
MRTPETRQEPRTVSAARPLASEQRVAVPRAPLASTEQVAEHLGVPVKTLYQWRWLGVGPRGVRVGRHLRYRWSDVDRWLDEQAAAGAA